MKNPRPLEKRKILTSPQNNQQHCQTPKNLATSETKERIQAAHL